MPLIQSFSFGSVNETSEPRNSNAYLDSYLEAAEEKKASAASDAEEVDSSSEEEDDSHLVTITERSYEESCTAMSNVSVS